MLLRFLTKVFSVAQTAATKVTQVDWSSIVTGVANAIRGNPLKVDPQYMVIKPAILSDTNVSRVVTLVRTVLSFIPNPVGTIAGPLIGLGQVGFNIWKHIAFSSQYDELSIPPADPNIVRVFFMSNPVLAALYGAKAADPNLNEVGLEDLEAVYNDLTFMTDSGLLKAKYPLINEVYLQEQASANLVILNNNLTAIQQGLIKVSNSPETQIDVGTAFNVLLDVFPAMNNWSMFSSDGSREVLALISAVI